MLQRLLRCLGLGLALAAVVTHAHSHHSYAEYDDTRMTEIEGTLVRAAMQNPHVRFAVEGVDANGRAITWDLEITSLKLAATFERTAGGVPRG